MDGRFNELVPSGGRRFWRRGARRRFPGAGAAAVPRRKDAGGQRKPAVLSAVFVQGAAAEADFSAGWNAGRVLAAADFVLFNDYGKEGILRDCF